MIGARHFNADENSDRRLYQKPSARVQRDPSAKRTGAMPPMFLGKFRGGNTKNLGLVQRQVTDG
jgi:hypothetical protein